MRRNNKKHYRLSSHTFDKVEGIIYSRMSKKFVVKAYRNIRNRLVLCSIAAFEKKEDAQICFDDYKQSNPVTV